MVYAYICCFALVALNLLGSSEAKQAAARVDELHETESHGAEGTAGHEAALVQVDAKGNVNEIKQGDVNGKEMGFFRCVVNSDTTIEIKFSMSNKLVTENIAADGTDPQSIQGTYVPVPGSTAEYQVFT